MAPRSTILPEALPGSTDKVIAAFRASLIAESMASRSEQLYVGHLTRFAAWLEQHYAANLLGATRHDVGAYRTQLAADYRPASVNAALSVLRRFYRWAGQNEWIPSDPTRTLKFVPSQPLPPQGFTPVERHRLRRVAEQAGTMTDAIVTVLLNTGVRVDELVRLTWAEVTVRPRSGWAVIKGKGQKVRTVPLNAAVREALGALQPEAATGPIFRGKRGPYTDRGIRNLLTRVGQRADVPNVHPHRFRHDAARRLVESVNLPTVAAFLGHSRLDTVRLYTQPDLAALERAAAVLENS